uniref:BTB domain-containing protein n=1 Tax=Panagrellus redivivus TaxID=6233 RepID=A0A7E4VFA4_PANRE
MSFASNNTVIKRFTYDWLIRFAELHPIEINDYDVPDYGQVPQGPQDPLESKYAAISPFFTTIISRYMPYIFHKADLLVENGVIKAEEDELPPHNKTKVYACENLEFSNLKPGTISLLKNNRISFYYSKALLMLGHFLEPNSRNTFTADEVKHVLKSCPFGEIFHACANFDKPTPFSEICPLLSHYKEIRMGISNLIYDENIANVMNQCHVAPNEIDLRDLNISDKVILEMLGYFVSLPQCPNELTFTFLKPKPILLFDAVVEKFVSAGYRLTNGPKPETPFKLIQIAVENYDFVFSCSNLNP